MPSTFRRVSRISGTFSFFNNWNRRPRFSSRKRQKSKVNMVKLDCISTNLYCVNFLTSTHFWFLSLWHHTDLRYTASYLIPWKIVSFCFLQPTHIVDSSTLQARCICLKLSKIRLRFPPRATNYLNLKNLYKSGYKKYMNYVAHVASWKLNCKNLTFWQNGIRKKTFTNLELITSKIN